MLGLSSNATIMVPPAIHCTRPATRTGISCAALTATRSVPVRAQAVSSTRSALLSSRRFIRILLIRLPIRHLSSRSDHEAPALTLRPGREARGERSPEADTFDWCAMRTPHDHHAVGAVRSWRPAGHNGHREQDTQRRQNRQNPPELLHHAALAPALSRAQHILTCWRATGWARSTTAWLACLFVMVPPNLLEAPRLKLGAGFHVARPSRPCLMPRCGVDAAARSALWVALRLSYSALRGSVDGRRRFGIVSPRTSRERPSCR